MQDNPSEAGICPILQFKHFKTAPSYWQLRQLSISVEQLKQVSTVGEAMSASKKYPLMH